MLVAPPVDIEPIYDPHHLRNALLAAGVVVICATFSYLIAWSIMHGH